jgi:DNA-binding response OmpR family regulator
MSDCGNNAEPTGKAADPLPQPLAGLRCLVLDDEFLIALDIEHILQAAGASHVTCAGNLADALALRNEAPFAVAVIDLGGDDSMTISTALQERSVPFVFLTGLSGDDPRARRHPQAPVVDKPFQAGGLLAASGRALRRAYAAAGVTLV